MSCIFPLPATSKLSSFFLHTSHTMAPKAASKVAPRKADIKGDASSYEHPASSHAKKKYVLLRHGAARTF